MGLGSGDGEVAPVPKASQHSDGNNANRLTLREPEILARNGLVAMDPTGHPEQRFRT